MSPDIDIDDLSDEELKIDTYAVFESDGTNTDIEFGSDVDKMDVDIDVEDNGDGNGDNDNNSNNEELKETNESSDMLDALNALTKQTNVCLFHTSKK